MIADDPITVAQYAKKHGLLKLRSFRTAQKFQHGFRVPRSHKEALELDQQNGNQRWEEATKLELKQLDKCEVFVDKGEFQLSKGTFDLCCEARWQK